MSDELLRHAVELAWRHWTTLGVRGVAPAPRYPVDLEALIAFTPFIAAGDPRLDEETRDWCTRIGPDFVSVSRLRQLVKLIGEPIPRSHISFSCSSVRVASSALARARTCSPGSS